MAYTVVGQIISTFGIRGELKVYPLTSDPARFKKNHKFFLGENKECVHITKARVDKNLVIVKFEEFDSINQVLSYVKNYIFVDEDDRIELSEGEYFISDLIGLKVYSDLGLVGEITNVIENPANDIYVVTNDGADHLVPAVKEFIKEVNLQEGRVTINWIEGL